MPGYKLQPVEDFARLQSLLCPSCSFLLREALQTEQGIRLCKSCYDEIQSYQNHTCPRTGLKLEPNEPFHPDVAVRKEIERLIVKCANHESGCTWEGTVKEHETQHKQCCPAPCTHKGCGVMVPATMLVQHMEHECEFREVSCPDCGQMLQYNQLQVHLDNQCSMRMVSCPNCQIQLLSTDLETHLLRECSSQQCVVCGIKVYKDSDEAENMDTHLSTPRMVFEHNQKLGVMVQARQKAVQQVEEDLVLLRSEMQQAKAKIDSLEAAISVDTNELRELIHRLDEARGNAVTSALKEFTARLEQQDKRIQTLGAQQQQGSFYPSSQPAYGKEGVPSDKLIQVEKKVEEVERQTAMVKVHISELELQLQASLASTYNGAFLWRIPDVKRRRRDAMESKITSIYSPPFYTGRNGYKMCIRAYLNGDGIGANTHLSIFFVLMKGEYDPLLKWPFDYKVSLILVDQDHRRHIVQTFKPSPSSNSFKQPVQDMNIASGCPKFAELNVLDNENYVKEDVMYIKCIVDTSRIFHP